MAFISSYQSSALLGLVIIVALFLRFVFKFHFHRQQYASLPGPPHSYWLGHLKLVGETLKELPPGLHMHAAVTHIAAKHGIKDVMYLDMWPAARPFMVIMNPEIANQLTLKNMPKHPQSKEFLNVLLGPTAVISLEGQEWKEVRGVLSPTYAPSYVLTLLPTMLQHLSTLSDRLNYAAKDQSVILLSDYLTDMTIDVMGDATLGIDLHAQSNPHPIAYYFKKAVKVCSESLADPLATYKNAPQMWWYTRNITKAVQDIVLERWEETSSKLESSRTTIDLMLSAARNKNPFISSGSKNGQLDRKALQMTVEQIKTLLLGGHDTSAATVSYVLCLLSQHPDILARVREEHSDLVQPSMTRDEAKAAIMDSPNGVNSLPLTTAVIKETLRIFPTSSTTRQPSPDHSIQYVESPAYPGQKLPLRLADQVIWLPHFPMHHDAEFFKDPYQFIPDRFIATSDYAQANPLSKDAWRPFEKGPRACIGTELAMVEMRVALVMILHEFNFTPAYPDDAPRVPESLGGVKWYQTMEFAAKPIRGMPMRVTLKSKS